MEISQDALNTLAQWDTPTICNGLEITHPERRAIGFTTSPMVCLDPGLPPIVGYARTATYRSTAPTADSAEEAQAKRLKWYRYVAEGGPMPAIVVIEDLDDEPGYGAFWGEVHTTVHKGLGALGGVTNGSIRDLPDSAKGFQLLAGEVGPSHAHGHLVEIGGDVNIFGMAVSPGDIIHADQHGAVVVPAEAVAQLPAAIDLISRREAKILAAAKAPDFNIDKLEAAIGAAGDIH